MSSALISLLCLGKFWKGWGERVMGEKSEFRLGAKTGHSCKRVRFPGCQSSLMWLFPQEPVWSRGPGHPWVSPPAVPVWWDTDGCPWREMGAQKWVTRLAWAGSPPRAQEVGLPGNPGLLVLLRHSPDTRLGAEPSPEGACDEQKLASLQMG